MKTEYYVGNIIDGLVFITENKLVFRKGCSGEQIYESRSIPGNLIGIGTDRKKSEESLRMLLEWTREEENFSKWYEEQLTLMTPMEKLVFRSLTRKE